MSELNSTEIHSEQNSSTSGTIISDKSTSRGLRHFLFGSKVRVVVCVVVILTVVVGLGGFTVYEIRHAGQDYGLVNPDSVPAAISNACTTEHPPFDTFPIALNEVSTITPLGHLDPPSHNFPVPHLYVNYAKQKDGNPVNVTFVSPGSITVSDIGIVTIVSDASNGKTYYDYKVSFTACDGLLSGYFIHLYQLSPQLANALGPISNNQLNGMIMGHESFGPGVDAADINYHKSVDVNLSSGATLGTAGGDANFTTNFDFGLSDARVDGQTADSAIWKPNDNNYVCGLNYFSQAIRSALYSKIGDYNQLSPAANQQCGEVYQDKSGTALGVWLTKGTRTQNQTIWSLNPHVISLIHNNINPNNFMVGFSSDVEQALGLADNSAYVVTPRTSGNINVPFDQVIPNGQVYCYQTTQQYSSTGQAGISFILEMTSPTSLRMGTIPGNSCGNGPWNFSRYIDLTR